MKRDSAEWSHQPLDSQNLSFKLKRRLLPAVNCFLIVRKIRYFCESYCQYFYNIHFIRFISDPSSLMSLHCPSVFFSFVSDFSFLSTYFASSLPFLLFHLHLLLLLTVIPTFHSSFFIYFSLSLMIVSVSFVPVALILLFPVFLFPPLFSFPLKDLRKNHTFGTQMSQNYEKLLPIGTL